MTLQLTTILHYNLYSILTILLNFIGYLKFANFCFLAFDVLMVRSGSKDPKLKKISKTRPNSGHEKNEEAICVTCFNANKTNCTLKRHFYGGPLGTRLFRGKSHSFCVLEVVFLNNRAFLYKCAAFP